VPPDATRRGAIVGAAAAVLAVSPASAAADAFALIEQRVGGRLGVAALDTASGARLGHRAGERFPMCSSFKLLAVGAALARVDQGHERLDRVIAYGEADLLDYAPVTRAHVREGGLPLGELCKAAIELSDNTAANLILRQIGGPAAVTAFARSLGDSVTRLDRNEPTLNTAIPGDPRDTTAPLLMLADLRALSLGGVLSPASRERLNGWLTDCKTGLTRLRAGFPAGWRVGDKTGTGTNGTANDVAIAWALGGPILIACYLTLATSATEAARDAAHAEVARTVVRQFRDIHG
jgi:beta-lactamase class A